LVTEDVLNDGLWLFALSLPYLFKINVTKGAQRHLHATYSQQRHAHKSNTQS